MPGDNRHIPSCMYKRTTTRPSLHRLIVDASGYRLRNCSDARSQRTYQAKVGFSGFGCVGVLPRKGERKIDRVQSLASRHKVLGVEYLDKDIDGNYFPVEVRPSLKSPPPYLVKSFNPSQTVEYLEGLAVRQAYLRSLHRTDPMRKRRICRGLTRRGKRSIADGCAILEAKYGVKGLGFYTLTCPYTETEDIAIFNERYPDIVRKYLQEIRRAYERKNVRFAYCGVFEVQALRAIRYGHRCLHFHYVAPCRNGNRGFVLSHADHMHIYRRVLERTCGLTSHHNPRVSCEVVRKSPAGYLAKYFSKGNPSLGGGGGDGETVSLSTWYSLSGNLRRSIRACCTRISAHDASAIYRASSVGIQLGGYSFIKAVYADISGEKRHVGAIFQLDKDSLSRHQKSLMHLIDL